MRTGRQRRLVEELDEIGIHLDGSATWHELAVEELDYALHPPVHERRIPSFGAVLDPTAPPAIWQEATQLRIERRPVGDRSVKSARRYADGVSTWLIRRPDHHDAWAVFDRPAGSERDLVVLAGALDATMVQRHPSGVIRLVGDFGVLRWDRFNWHHEPLVTTWISTVEPSDGLGRPDVLRRLLEFAVHDLGARGIGATLVYQPDGRFQASFEERLGVPPPLAIDHAADLAPLRHVLAQIDGATLFDADGVLRLIGVRLVPTATAETGVDAYRGMRHTAGRRYSFDDPTATVIVVSEDGPVSVFRAGELLGSSAPG